jgi:hypothetical protein
VQVAQEAAVHGEQAATVMLRRLVQSDPLLRRVFLDRARGHAVSSANQIGYDLAIRLDQTVPRVLRFADDAYRAAVQEAATRQVLAIDTPSTAQSFAWRKLTERGVTGLTDVSGRNWNLSTYAEMATRTAVQRAYNASHLDRMATVGIEYFTVSHDGHPCPLCLPWEGEILSTGSVGEVSTLAADRDEQVTFTVKATVDDAIAAGFQHPNCRHVLLPYLPGVTKTTTGQAWTDADQRRYDDTQRLREMERNVRAAKRETAAALTPLERQRAEAKVRAWQARIRQHVEASGLVRKPRRERLDLGNH